VSVQTGAECQRNARDGCAMTTGRQCCQSPAACDAESVRLGTTASFLPTVGCPSRDSSFLILFLRLYCKAGAANMLRVPPTRFFSRIRAPTSYWAPSFLAAMTSPSSFVNSPMSGLGRISSTIIPNAPFRVLSAQEQIKAPVARRSVPALPLEGAVKTQEAAAAQQ
jgi:hypothetical protein